MSAKYRERLAAMHDVVHGTGQRGGGGAPSTAEAPDVQLPGDRWLARQMMPTVSLESDAIKAQFPEQQFALLSFIDTSCQPPIVAGAREVKGHLVKFRGATATYDEAACLAEHLIQVDPTHKVTIVPSFTWRLIGDNDINSSQGTTNERINAVLQTFAAKERKRLYDMRDSINSSISTPRLKTPEEIERDRADPLLPKEFREATTVVTSTARSDETMRLFIEAQRD